MHKENVALGGMCAGLLAIAVIGGIADLRLAGKFQRSMTTAAILTQPGCVSPKVAATYSDAACAPSPTRTGVYYMARMEALAQN